MGQQDNPNKFAVCILFFEKAGQTVECVRSLLASQVPIYILNNNSSEKSARLLKEFCKNYPQVKIFDSPENLGVSGGRNFLIKNTTEEWLFFVDNDIAVRTKNWLEMINRHISESPEMEVFIPLLWNVHDGFFSFSTPFYIKDGTIKRLREMNEDGSTNLFPGGASFVKRSLFDRLGLYDEKMFVGFEDYELAFRAVKSGNLVKAIQIKDIELIHNHKMAKSEEDRLSIMKRYDPEIHKASSDRIKEKHGIALEDDWKQWISNQSRESIHGKKAKDMFKVLVKKIINRRLGKNVSFSFLKRSSSEKMKKTKICFVSINAYRLFDKNCQATHGGAEVDLYLLAKEYAKDDRFEVSFAVGDFGQKKEQLIENIKVINTGFKYRKSYKSLEGLIMYLAFLGSLRKIRADIYIQEVATTITAFVALYAMLSGKKFIYRTAHVMECGWDLLKIGGSLTKLYYWGLRHASSVICQSEEQKKMLKKNFWIDAIIIKNAHIIPTVSVDEKTAILSVGRCDKVKHPEIFFDISKNFPDVENIMICPKQEHEKDFFAEIEKKAENIKHLRFIEHVPFDQIQDYFNRAKIFVCTSDFEGFPNTYIQACIGSTPIVSLNVNPDNFINDNDLGYCAGGNMDKMIVFIRKLLTDGQDWKSKSENAYRYAKDNHDMQKIKEQWDKVLLDLISIK